MAATLTNSLTKLGLGEHREFLLSIARPSVEILNALGPVTRGCSKFGGSPDLPADFQWPTHKRGPYRFIGQFKLADVPKGPHGLPGRGLLSFFYAHDENGESFWGNPDYVRVYHFDKIARLQPVEPPTAVRLGTTRTVKFQRGQDVPPWPWDDSKLANWPIDDSHRDAYWKLRLGLHLSRRYLLGYPFNTTLGYDPTPRPGLALAADAQLGRRVGMVLARRRLAGDFHRGEAAARR